MIASPVTRWTQPATIDPRAHPSSPEFQAAYLAYLEAYPRWVDAPPLQAMCWRAVAIEGALV